MSRPRLRMLLIVAALVAIVLLAQRVPQSVPALAAVAVLAWVASVTLGRDFFRGRAAMAAGDRRAAIGHFERFIAGASSVRARALKMLWIGLYTSEPVAIALNNIGACYLNLDELDAARPPLERALEHDAGYALPHMNLAIVHRLQGDLESSSRHARLAVALGFSESVLDATVRRALALHNEATGRHV